MLWRDSRLVGTTPEEAFFVKVDRTTMTQNDLDNGRLIVLVGIAPLRPAEFVIFRIGHVDRTVGRLRHPRPVPDPRRTPTTTAAGVLRPDQLAQHVTLERAECSPELAPWVENYWSLRWDLPPGTSYLSSTLPHPACNLSVERGIRRDGVGDDPVVVTGVVTRRFDVTIRDAGWVYAAKFRPGGLAALTGAHARDLRDATVPASTVFDPATTDALHDLAGIPGGKDVFDDVLGRLATTPTDDYLLLLDVIAAMLADRSLLRVAEVEERCGVGTRTLQRLFERYVGVTPQVGAVPLPDARRGHRPRRGIRRIARRPRGQVRLVRPGPLHPRVHRPGRRTSRCLPGSVGCPLSRKDQPGLVGEHDGLHAVAQVELAEDATHVRLRGGLGDEQRLSDLGVGQATSDPARALRAHGR